MSSFSFKDLLKGSFWIVLATTVARLSGFLVLFILARILTPEGLGMYNLVQTSIQNGDALSRIGVDIAIHRNGSQHVSTGEEATGRLFGVGATLMVGFSILLATFLFFNQTFIAKSWLNQPRIEPWFSLIAFTIFISTLSNPPWLYLVALHSFRIHSIRTSIVSIAGAFITLVLAFFFGLSGAIGGLTVTAIIQAILGWGLAANVLKKHNVKLRIDKFIAESRNIFSFGLPFYASNSLSALTALPLLGYISSFGGLEQLGFLRVAQSLSQLVSFLPAAISPVLISTLSANLVSDPNEYQKIKSLHLRITWIVMMLLSSITCFSLDYLLPILFGSAYDQAVFLSRITIWITVVGSLSAILNQYVVSAGKMRSIMVIQTTALIIHTILAILLIPIYNSIGLLIAQSVSTSLTAIAYVYPALIDIKPTDKKTLILLLIINIFLMVISIALPLVVNSSVLISSINVVCFALAVIILWEKSFTTKEKRVVFSIVNSKFKKHNN